MRIAIIATTIVMTAVLAAIAVIAAVQLGFFDGAPDDASTERRAEPDAELVGLITEPRGPIFTELGERIRLEVLGVYSDGIARPLADDAQMAFSSSAPEFVSIDSRGMMTATGDGGADVVATYGGFSAHAPAVVFLPASEIPPIDPNMVYLMEDGSAIILDRLIVFTKDEYSGALARRIASRHNGDVIADFPSLDAFLVEISASTITDLEAALKHLNQDPDVDEAFPDGLFPASQGSAPHIPETVSRSQSGKTDGMKAYENVHLFDAWDILNGLNSQSFTHVYVAVIDDGMYDSACNRGQLSKAESAVKQVLDHEFPYNQLQRIFVLKEGYCADKFDEMYHGTAIVSVLAAADNASTAAKQGLNRSFSGVLSSVVNLPYSVLVYDSNQKQSGKRSGEARKGKEAAEGIKAALDEVQEFNSIGVVAARLNNISTKSAQIRVVNLSYGCVTHWACRLVLKKFANNNDNKHTLIVTTAGNDKKNIGNWSADGVLVVGGTNGGSDSDSGYPDSPGASDCSSPQNGTKITGRHVKSNYGEAINIAAPYCVYVVYIDRNNIENTGLDITPVLPGDPTKTPPEMLKSAQDNIYNAWPGTSFSAPLVSGTAALLFAIAPELTAKQVTEILDRTADEIANCTPDCAGWKSLNAHAAVCETLYGLGSENDATPCPAPQPTPTPLLPWIRSGQTRMAQPTPTPLLPWMRSGQTRMAQPTPTTPQPAPTQTVAACVPGSIGDTGVRVSAQSFFETKVTSDSYFDSLMTGPVLGLGMEEDFYADNNLAALVWMLRFDVPEDAGEVALNYRWVRVLRGGELSVISTGALEVGGEDHKYVVSLAVKGLTDAPSIWLPGQYFVDAWSTQHDCAVAEWYFEVH